MVKRHEPKLKELRRLAQKTLEESSAVIHDSLVLRVRMHRLLQLQPLEWTPRHARNGTAMAAAAAIAQRQAPHPLSRRELEVLRLVVEGRSTREIAAELSISFKTAASHRANIMSKLGVHETASLVRESIRWGLIQP